MIGATSLAIPCRHGPCYRRGMKKLGALVLVAAVGCSSSYLPQARGRVAITMQNGQVTYVRDGRQYPHGILGGGLEDAVVGNPAAMAAAHEYTSRMTTGIVGVLLGTAGLVGGMTWVGYQAGSESNGDNVGLPLALTVVGLVVMCVGAGYAASAEPYRWDAINMFNEFNEGGAPPPMPLPAPGYGAPGYGASAKASLRMPD